MIRRLLCWLGIHGPNWFGNNWGRLDEPFVRECPHCGMRWYGDEVVRYSRAYGCEVRTLGDWKTRKQCIKDGEWRGDKFPGQKY